MTGDRIDRSGWREGKGGRKGGGGAGGRDQGEWLNEGEELREMTDKGYIMITASL